MHVALGLTLTQGPGLLIDSYSLTVPPALSFKTRVLENSLACVTLCVCSQVTSLHYLHGWTWSTSRVMISLSQTALHEGSERDT